MFFATNQLLGLQDIIQHLNAFNDDEERDKYLRDNVEDTELFISILKEVNKSKLIKSKKKKEISRKSDKYTEEMIITIFKENSLDSIVTNYSKQELTEMYLTFFSSRPLTSCDKKRIAQNINHYIYTMNRAEALLG